MRTVKIPLCVIFMVLFLAATATAQETLAQSVVRYRDFFVQLNGYSDCLLSDVELIDGNSIGVILLSPEGFEQHFVFDIKSMRPIYANARILSRSERDFLLDTGISMSDVKKLATAAKNRAVELRRGWTVYEGKPGNIIPKNSSTEKIETTTVDQLQARENKGHISNISKEIEKEVAAMSTEEILERFRAELKKYTITENVA